MARQQLPLLLTSVLLLNACSNTWNPLEDYEQLTPSTILESPEPSAQSNYPAERVEKANI